MRRGAEEIVPEYRSRIPLVRYLFWRRIRIALVLIHLKKGNRVLDVGCGNGYLLKELSLKHKNWHGFGVDIYSEVRNIKLPGCTFLVGDICSLPFPDDHFDFVFALDVLEHIWKLEQAMKEIKRVLKNGGILIVSGPTETVFYKLCRFLLKGTFSQVKGPASEHYCDITQIIQRIKQNNFRIDNIRKLPFLRPFVLQKIIRFKNEG